MDNQHKINEFIKLAEGNDLFDVFFEDIKFMNKPYYKIHFKYELFNGTFDVSNNTFSKVSNETIIKEILRGFKFNG